MREQMMKRLKKMISCMVAMVMLLSVLLVPSIPAKASEMYGAVPQKIRINVQEQDVTALSFDYAVYGEYVTNIKTSSKNLKAKQVVDYQETGLEDNSNYAQIGLYAFKKGTYKVTFDINNADGTKKESHKVTVYAYSDSPLKSITIGNHDIANATDEDAAPNIVNMKSGKLKVNLNKGYKIIDIAYATANEDGTANTFTIKNGSKVTLGTVIPKVSIDVFEGESNLKMWSTQLFAPTAIAIVYKDKYTKEYDYLIYTVYKKVK
jgi:hypothetical protein